MSGIDMTGRSDGTAHAPVVLYLLKGSVVPSCAAKFAGIRRYCVSRGWEAELVARPEFTPEAVAAILRERRPVGCVVDGVTNNVGLPPRLFRGVPVAYIGYMRGRTGTWPNFHFDAKAIAETAFRELSTNRPPCYAAVGFPIRLRWPPQRIAAFRGVVQSSGAVCHEFPLRRGRPLGSWEEFDRRLAQWLAGLPEHCAVFAVSDEVAVRVARAAHAAKRHIPRSLTLVSVDNFPELCERADPPISSIQLDFERMGFVATRALGEIVSRRGAEGAETQRRKRIFATKNAKGHKDFVNSVSFAANARYSPPILVGPLMVARRESTSGHGRHEAWILEAVEVVRREACNGLGVRDLLDRFPQSRRNFERRFREAMGCSVLYEILRVRLEAATTLLAQTDTAIAAVPDMCGFRSYRALDFHFRSRFGMSMGAWRERNAR